MRKNTCIFKQGCQKTGPFRYQWWKTGSVICFFLEKGGLSYTWQRWKRGLFGTHIRTMSYIGSYSPSPEVGPIRGRLASLWRILGSLLTNSWRRILQHVVRSGWLLKVPDRWYILQYRAYHYFVCWGFYRRCRGSFWDFYVGSQLFCSPCLLCSECACPCKGCSKVHVSIYHFKGVAMKPSASFLFEILSMTHFVGLNLICQVSSQSSNAERSLWSNSLSLSFSITLKNMIWLANSLVSEDSIETDRPLMKGSENCSLWESWCHIRCVGLNSIYEICFMFIWTNCSFTFAIAYQ